MAETSPSESLLRGMRPEVARRRIESFRKRFGEAHLYLAQHAAFPLTLTPDLLYHLWANFQQDIHGEKLGIPWIAIADLLLSSLCEEVGYELFEMDAAVRDALLHDLKANPNFGERRLEQLSDFLLVYVRQQLDSYDPDIRDFAKTQRWIALAFTETGKAEVAHELAVALRSSLEQNDRAEQLRMASLIETFAEPLGGFTPLFAYGRGVGYLARGDIERAMAQFSDVTGREDSVQVLGIGLPIPKQVSKESKEAQQQVPADSAITENTTISDDIRIGQQIGNYLIVKKLTDGPSGSIYLGQDPLSTDRTVAIKLLHAHLASAEESKQFIQEARLLRKFKHPHILPILNAGIQDGIPYLVTEYASGGSLQARLKQQAGTSMPIDDALTIITQIGQALYYAHQQDVVHRDLKPGNILFNARGEALLADFGIAVILATSGTRNLGQGGTPAYMAPEQFEGKVSIKSDQYALGCIAYELLTGKIPFVVTDPVALTQLNPDIPVHIERAILKVLAKDPKDRFANVSSFIAALLDATKCPYCGSETRPGDNFCLNCGNRLLPSTPSPQQAQAAIGDATILASEDWVSSGAEHSPHAQKSDRGDEHLLTIANTNMEPQATLNKVAHPAHLILRTDTGEVLQEYPLEKPAVSIGRAPNSDILLSKDKLTSRHHATIRYENGNYVLRDERSANGTFVNGQQLEELTSHPLQDGDHIGIGEHELVFQAYKAASSGVDIESMPTITVNPSFSDVTFQSVSRDAPDITRLSSPPQLTLDTKSAAPYRGPKRLRGEITFENVVFGYTPEHPILKGINLHIPAGRKVALVGLSGGERPALVRLISRLYEIQQGVVRIDGVDNRMYPLSVLRQNVSMVLRDNVLFEGTIRENIEIGKPGASFEEVIDAAKKAHMHDTIMSFPDKYNTRVREQGKNFSVGQLQRLAIAQSILRDSPILILDDPTAALDVEEEAEVMHALDTLVVGRTVLMISNRLSILGNVDEIIVLKDGRIVEQGTFKELKRRGGMFASLLTTVPMLNAQILIEVDGKIVGQRLLDKPVLTVGRLSGNDVQIPSQRVSRLHAKIRWESGAWVIEDAESLNGLIFNGQRVDQHILRNGDRIYLAPTAVIQFTQEDGE